MARLQLAAQLARHLRNDGQAEAAMTELAARAREAHEGLLGTQEVFLGHAFAVVQPLKQTPPIRLRRSASVAP